MRKFFCTLLHGALGILMFAGSIATNAQEAAVQVFAIFSFSFGGPATADAEIPASARGH